MIRNKVVWDKHYYSNRFTVRNIFLLRYSRFRLMCTFKANTSDTETSFLDLNIKVIGSNIHTSVYDKRDDFSYS